MTDKPPEADGFDLFDLLLFLAIFYLLWSVT